MENPIDRAIEYLKANDVHEDFLERELAEALEEFKGRLTTAVRDANYALYRSSEFAGLIADGDEEINEPWNSGGHGYEAHIKLMQIEDELANREAPVDGR